MNTPSAPEPERPSSDGTNGSADDDAPLAPEQSEAALRPGHLTGGPDRQEASGQAGDDGEDDEYEPL